MPIRIHKAKAVLPHAMKPGVLNFFKNKGHIHIRLMTCGPECYKDSLLKCYGTLLTTLQMVTVMGWSHTKRPKHCGHFLIYCVSPFDFPSFLIHLPKSSGKYQHRPLVVNQEKLGDKWWQIFPMKSLFHTLQG
jgi:hypothetical protein